MHYDFVYVQTLLLRFLTDLFYKMLYNRFRNKLNHSFSIISIIAAKIILYSFNVSGKLIIETLTARD